MASLINSEMPNISFDKDFFTNLVKDVTNELKLNKSAQQSPNANAKHGTRLKTQSQPVIDVDSISVIVSCITRALIPIITDSVKLALASSVPPPPPTSTVISEGQVEENIRLRIGIDDANQYSRRDSCRINGLAQDDGENEVTLVDKIVKVGSLMGTNIVKEDISIAHRLPVKVKGIQQVIVKFCSRRAKMEFYGARIKLKDIDECNDLFINEDLTKLRFSLMMTARKAPGVRSVVTYNGVIKVWITGKDAAVTIKHPEDLEKLGLKPDYQALGLL